MQFKEFHSKVWTYGLNPKQILILQQQQRNIANSPKNKYQTHTHLYIYTKLQKLRAAQPANFFVVIFWFCTYHRVRIVANRLRTAKRICKRQIHIQQLILVQVDGIAYLRVLGRARVNGIQMTANNEHFAELAMIQSDVKVVFNFESIGIQLEVLRRLVGGERNILVVVLEVL